MIGEKMISDFKGYYNYLSNFYSVQVELDGVTYPSVEHAYQAAKTLDHQARQVIREAPTAGKAKRAGQQVQMRSDWEQVKVDVMRSLLRQKFENETLAGRLQATKGEMLVEGNWWHDNFWGDCSCSKCASKPGLNWLGRLLMEIRDDRREEK
jgi:ribA/ribD-fused uncharacterized protein